MANSESDNLLPATPPGRKGGLWEFQNFEREKGVPKNSPLYLLLIKTHSKPLLAMRKNRRRQEDSQASWKRLPLRFVDADAPRQANWKLQPSQNEREVTIASATVP